LLDDLLDFARSESQQLRARIGAYRIEQLLTPIIQRFSTLAEQKELQLLVSPLPEIAVVVDESHFKRIISNLLSNGIKYTNSGSVSLEFATIGSRLNITVSDT